MRILVKRILRRYGYPPDLSDLAAQTVSAQAEALLRGRRRGIVSSAAIRRTEPDPQAVGGCAGSVTALIPR